MIGVGIEATPSEVRIASVTRRRGRRAVLEVARYARDAAGAVAWRARPHRALVALPLAQTTHRLLAMPFGDEATLAQVVPLELRGQLPSDPGDVRIGFEVVGRDAASAHVLAVLVRGRDVEAAAGAAGAMGAAVLGLTPGPLALRWLLPPGFTGSVLLADGGDSSLAIWEGGMPCALRALTARADDPGALAEELVWSLAALGHAGESLLVLGPDASAALVDACRRRHLLPDTPSLSHLALELEPSSVLAAPVACGLALGAIAPRARVPFARTPAGATLLTRRVRRLAMAATLLAVLDVGVLRMDLARRAARLQTALAAEAARALPGEPIVAPRAQLEAATAATRRGAGQAAHGTALARLREVSERIPEGLVLDLTRLTLDGEHLLLVGNAPTFESVDVLRRALTASARLRDVAADEVRTTVDGKRVSFRLRARWAARGEAAS